LQFFLLDRAPFNQKEAANASSIAHERKTSSEDDGRTSNQRSEGSICPKIWIMLPLLSQKKILCQLQLVVFYTTYIARS
jgi:hypothetical protein